MDIQHEDCAMKTRKKKCRGDRKRQRFRRQLYRQGLDSDTIKRKEEGKFGDLYIKFKIMIPTNLSQEEQELFVKLSKMRS